MRLVAILIVATLLLAIPAAAQDGAKSAASKPGPSTEQIQQWIASLGADRFDERDQAMQSLIAAGQHALKPILAAAYGKDREVALRSIVALQEIGARGDVSSLQAALSALDEITSKAPSAVIARQAADARGSLAAVRQQRAIEHLEKLGAVVMPECTDQGYIQLARIHVLIFVIEIGPNWKGTDEDLERLSWITDLEQVNFVGPKVKDSWIQSLKNLPKLNSVKIKHANISNKAIEELAKIEGLWFLRLLYVPLDDTAVPYITQSQSLRKVVFISKELSEQGIDRLARHFGKENIDCPKGAMLGISASILDGTNWRVGSVVEGSAAAKAGILAGDRITKYNGMPVGDFASLRALIAMNAPGDTATVEIERGLERIVKQVTFGEWD